MNPFMWVTVYSSCSHVWNKKTRSISLGVQINIGPLCCGKAQQFKKRIQSVPNSYLSLLFWTLSLIITFLFLMISHFPSFLVSFTFWSSFPSSTWSSVIRYSFTKIPKPFRLGDLVRVSNLWSLQLYFNTY